MKIYRRTWEKWAQGRIGAISVPLAARSGSDGAIAGASAASPVQVLTSATASFISTDVGRLIRLTSTPNNRFDGLYIIDAVNSSTSVNLRYNHNTGAPTSVARFMENGTSIVWRIMESCTFTADAAGDFANYMAGSHIAVEGATNLSNTGLWRISHYVDSQTVLLTKSYIFWVADATAYATYTSDALSSFTSESGLTWSLVDREPINGADLAGLVVQQLIDSGYALWQHRGPVSISTTNNILFDVVLRSVGETDATNLPSGRISYFRLVGQLHNRASQGTGLQYNFLIAPFHHWDVTGTATSPGNGIGGMKVSTATYSAATPTPAAGNTICEFPLDTGTGTTDLLSQGRAGLPFDLYRRDLVMFSDADEFYIFVNNSGLSNNWTTFFCSALSPVAANPYLGVAIATTTTTQINTGTVDFATKGYAVGDNLTVRGLSTSTPEYLETTSITSFDNTDPSNRKINVTAMSRTYGNGTDGGVKAYVGEDPFPIFVGWNISGNAPGYRSHNISRGGFATGRDFDLTNAGTTAVGSLALSSFTEISPNRRSGKTGIIPLHGKITTNSEFRGKFRYVMGIDASSLTQGKKLWDSVNNLFYVLVEPNLSASAPVACAVLGPLSAQQAGVKL